MDNDGIDPDNPNGPSDDEIASIQARLDGLNLRDRLVDLFGGWSHDYPVTDMRYAYVHIGPVFDQMAVEVRSLRSETRALRAALELAAEHLPTDCPHHDQIMALLPDQVTADAPAPDVEDPQVPGPRRLPGEPAALDPG